MMLTIHQMLLGNQCKNDVLTIVKKVLPWMVALLMANQYFVVMYVKGVLAESSIWLLY